ncbi:MAG: NAD(P)H-hydrate dehydratase [Methylococcales symbiont of Iophon sp. n. MRB-2018]|nr:MAG: NAD(P)H-hydrate dehydratase [Methylococcales symbiont of Iophon sp. n. MRB-2018]
MQTLPEKLYLAAQVREMDRLSIEEYGIAGIELMRRAGQVLFDIIQKYYSTQYLVVFCGAGNNAGDGYMLAKLALQAGFKVDVYYLTDPEKLQDDALIAYQDYLKAKGSVMPFSPDIVFNKAIIVDALLGTGLNRDVTGSYADAIDLINASNNAVLSVDIPSGLNADTGSLMAKAVKSNHTVSFIGLKQGMFTGMAAEYRGEIIYASLAIPEPIFQQVNNSSRLINACTLAKRHRCSHKGDNGHVLLIGGDEGYCGAIRLAAEAALRSGAGLVSIASRKSHAAMLNNGRPELMCHGIETVSELDVLLNKATVIVIGPGLGQSQWAIDLFKQAIKTDKPLVLDADALNLLAKHHYYKHQWVLTPHPGEAARLLQTTTGKIANDRFLCITQIQKKYGGVAILKGAGTLISDGKEIKISTTGNPGMASGGMGDVLSGMIAGLIAQGFDLSKVAASAVYLHGKAADLSAQQDGEVGMVASDLMPFIRKLVNQ